MQHTGTTRRSARRGVIRSAVVMTAVAVALIAASCAPPAGGGGTNNPGPTNFQFRANKVTVVNNNDDFVYGSSDEPFVIQLWFRVRLGDPNSAQAGVVGDRSAATFSLSNSQSRTLGAGQQAAVDFNNVKMLDVLDLFGGNDHLEVLGTWTWAMERDDVGVGGVPQDLAGILQDALNLTVAAGGLPEDPNALVALITDDLGRALNLVAGSVFNSIPGIPDDAIGSQFYVGLGTKGALGDIIEATAPNVSFPNIAIPIVSIPPDIGGGRIFSLNKDHTFPGEVFDQGSGRHTYDMQMVDTGNPNQAPTADFTLNTTSGSTPLALQLDASSSSDPDGSVTSFAWDFGDFTTGTGAQASHTFTNGGSYPVTLTVTDNRGASVSKTVNVTVAGGPTVAPTGLTKIGSGCCATYGNFTWNPVPGAEAYRISMEPTLGCIATSATQEFTGQVSGGTVSKTGLCLGTRYDIKIQARANGFWGPWSPTQNITL